MKKKELKKLVHWYQKKGTEQRKTIKRVVEHNRSLFNELRDTEAAVGQRHAALIDLLRFAESMPGFNVHPYTAKARAIKAENSIVREETT